MIHELSTPAASLSSEDAVHSAISKNDLLKLQELSLSPGGFGNRRKEAWPFLLGVSMPGNMNMSPLDASSPREETTIGAPISLPPQSSIISTGSDTLPLPVDDLESTSDGYTLNTSSSGFLKDFYDLAPHPDEHQVQLDTNRSFILYPAVESSSAQRKIFQEDLHDIILGVLRKRPALRYFQGYHDIITVLFLTLPPELVLACAEKLSLHRLRDSMGKGLEPLVGQLRILKRLLRKVDPPYAAILEKNASLPYYALSNLLTLFSHDVPTLPLVQHVFDWLFCRPSIASIWLAAAVILRKKNEVLALEKEGDEAMGMVHAVLSTLPPLSDKDHVSESPTHVQGTPISELYTNENKLSQPAFLQSEVSSASFPVTGGTKEETMEFEFSEGLASDLSDEPASLIQSQSDLGPSSFPSHPASPSFPGEYKEKAKDTIPLSDLLKQADDLLSDYPPSSPALRLTETFGLQSPLRSNIIVPSSLDDNEAEDCVGGDDVVLPPSQEELDEELGNTKEEKESERQNERKKRRERERRIAIRRQVVIAGAVLCLGVAIALYGLSQNARGNGRDTNGRFAVENVKWLAAWVGATLGVGERLGVGL